jgi:hypothetical protein
MIHDRERRTAAGGELCPSRHRPTKQMSSSSLVASISATVRDPRTFRRISLNQSVRRPKCVITLAARSILQLRQRRVGQLECGIAPQMKGRRRPRSRSRSQACDRGIIDKVRRVGSRRSGNTRANWLAKRGAARSPREASRPQRRSDASHGWQLNGIIIPSIEAGVAFAIECDGVGFTTESLALYQRLGLPICSRISCLYTTKESKILERKTEPQQAWIGSPEPLEQSFSFSRTILPV